MSAHVEGTERLRIGVFWCGSLMVSRSGHPHVLREGVNFVSGGVSFTDIKLVDYGVSECEGIGSSDVDLVNVFPVEHIIGCSDPSVRAGFARGASRVYICVSTGRSRWRTSLKTCSRMTPLARTACSCYRPLCALFEKKLRASVLIRDSPAGQNQTARVTFGTPRADLSCQYKSMSEPCWSHPLLLPTPERRAATSSLVENSKLDTKNANVCLPCFSADYQDRN